MNRSCFYCFFFFKLTLHFMRLSPCSTIFLGWQLTQPLPSSDIIFSDYLSTSYLWAELKLVSICGVALITWLMTSLASVIYVLFPRLWTPYWMCLMLYFVSQNLITYLALSRCSVNSCWMCRCVSVQNKGMAKPTDRKARFPVCCF